MTLLLILVQDGTTGETERNGLKRLKADMDSCRAAFVVWLHGDAEVLGGGGQGRDARRFWMEPRRLKWVETR